MTKELNRKIRLCDNMMIIHSKSKSIASQNAMITWGLKKRNLLNELKIYENVKN